MKESTFYKATDIMDLLEVSRYKAYGIIKELNEELVARGYRTIAGRISKRYFHLRYFDCDTIESMNSNVIDA